MTPRVVAALALGFLVIGPSHAATLTILLTEVESDHGLVRVSVCTKETFTTRHCQYAGAAPARPGKVTIVILNIPAGEFAIQAYHDEDGDGRLRRGLFGIPTEAIGFSRDAPLRMGPPRFGDAAITVTEPGTETTIRLRHVDR